MRKGDPSDVPPVERRPLQRKRVLLGGIITYASGAHSFACTFRNLAASGARINIGRDMQFPSEFYLINVKDQLAHEAKVIWNNGTEVGVEFKQTFQVDKITDPAVSFLKALWLSKAPR